MNGALSQSWVMTMSLNQLQFMGMSSLPNLNRQKTHQRHSSGHVTQLRLVWFCLMACLTKWKSVKNDGSLRRTHSDGSLGLCGSVSISESFQRTNSLLCANWGPKSRSFTQEDAHTSWVHVHKLKSEPNVPKLDGFVKNSSNFKQSKVLIDRFSSY